jgi:hypothetical protein
MVSSCFTAVIELALVTAMPTSSGLDHWPTVCRLNHGKYCFVLDLIPQLVVPHNDMLFDFAIVLGEVEDETEGTVVQLHVRHGLTNVVLEGGALHLCKSEVASFFDGLHLEDEPDPREVEDSIGVAGDE